MNPNSDVQITNWSKGAGSGSAAWEELNELVNGAGRDDATSYWTTATNSAELIVGMATPAGTIKTTQPSGSGALQFYIYFRNAEDDPNVTVTIYETTTVLWQYTTTKTMAAGTWNGIAAGISNTIMAGVNTANVRIGIKRNSGTGAFDVTAATIGYRLVTEGGTVTIDEQDSQLFVSRGATPRK